MAKKSLLWGSSKTLIQLTHVDDGMAIYVRKCDVGSVTKSTSPAATAVNVQGLVHYVQEAVDDVLLAIQ